MILFFRKLRQKLLVENKFSNYLKYAIGEIILVVIGILVALQVNNWNENRKQNESFTGLLEQIYNAIYWDYQWQKTIQDEIFTQYKYIDTLLTDPTTISPDKLIPIVYYVDLAPARIDSKTATLIQFIDLNSNNKKQDEISKQLIAYGGDFFSEQVERTYSNSKSISSILQRENIPQPHLVFGFSSFREFNNYYVDSLFYDSEDLQHVEEILNSKEAISALKTLRSRKEYSGFIMNNMVAENEKYLKLIKESYPSVNLAINDISIVGTALPSGWYEPIPMEQSSTDLSKWEITTQLNDGYLKFRTGSSWTYNWGGKTFPNGNTLFYGEDIAVKKGTYHITLDLDSNTYQFVATDGK